MRSKIKIISLLLVVVTLVSMLALPASAEYYYPMAVTIYYKNESGQQVAPALSTSINASSTDKPTWTSPTVSGYVLKNSGDSVVTYAMLDKSFPASNYVRHGSATYTVYYTDQAAMNVYYIFGSSMRTAASMKTVNGKIGNTYYIASPSITGYTPTFSSVSGTYSAKSASRQVYYYENTYTVTYNANGGSGAPSSQTKKYFTDLTLSSTTPTRTGYSFQGWAINAFSSSPSYSPGDKFTSNANVTLYAVWSSNKYTVSYNANGGSGAPSSQTKLHGKSMTLSNTKPTRSGYTFAGWSTTSTGSVSYQPGGTYTSNSSATLYAVWQKNAATYTVSYNANGGSGAPSSQTKTENVTLTLSSTKPSRSGYTFLGWNTSSTATYATYSAGGNYTSNSSATLYAVWQKNPSTYTVSYNANGGSGAPSSQTKTEDVVLTLSSTTPYRSGYTFQGWGTSSSSSYVSYYPGDRYYSNSSATLYAVWQKNVSYYTISYNANGGSGAPSSQTKTENETLTLSSTKPSRSGYTFLGWSTSSTASYASYSAGGSYSANASVTLYAVWDKNTEYYSVFYNANGGSGAPSYQIKTENVALTLSSTKPTRSGYAFLGWSTSSYASFATYEAGDKYTANASTTLYAVWYKDISYYSVTYNPNGGTGAPSAQTKTEDVALTLSSTIPTRSQYAFKGWSVSSSADTVSYFAGGTYAVNASVTLYAVWERVYDTYTVSYNANGGSGAPSTQTKVEGTNLTLSSTMPTRSKYSFVGWGTSSTSTSPSYYPGSTYSTDSGITLYAIWSRVYDSYTVSYNANGGSNAPASQTKIEGTTLTLSSQIPGRLGYTFLGWSTSSTATSPTYYAGGSYTANSGATLYAVWSRDVYTISYNANGGTGAPTSQSKYYDQAINITTATPARDSYKFLGWAETASATTPIYYAGDSYDANKSTTLYAVWQEVNYDFSVSNLTAAPSEVSQYDTVSVAFRIDSWDRYNPYTNIPVAVLMNGKTVYSTTVNIAAYGVKNISFNLNVGASEGTQRLEARVNWADHNNETRTGNNTVSTTFEIIKVIETSVDTATTNGEYVEGQEVITSFYVRNDNNRDILPTDNLTFDFKVYTVGNGGYEVAVVNQTKTGIVIPANGTNLVYFKWKVPEGSAGTPYWCRGSITPSRGEANTSNNATEFAIVSAPKYFSQTENTRYEDKAPGSYNASVSAPTNKAGSATWNEWTYENGAFVLKTYGITVSSDNPVITPSSGCTTAERYGSSWKMKSGYGIALSWNPTIRSYSGYSMPSGDAYTGVQTAYATFPEFSFNVAYGKYRTLEYADGKYQFEVNTDADKNERVHFIPVYVKDGSYTVSVTTGGIWTPAGQVTATRSANTVVISGTIYSDWYQS